MVSRRVFLASLAAAPLVAAEPEWRWLPPQSPELEIDGLPWFAQNEGEFYRLPAALREKFPPPVWELAKSPSGARIRFRTDAAAVAGRGEYPSAPGMGKMPAFGQTRGGPFMGGAHWGTGPVR